jgi:hypothetical protein
MTLYLTRSRTTPTPLKGGERFLSQKIQRRASGADTLNLSITCLSICQHTTTTMRRYLYEFGKLKDCIFAERKNLEFLIQTFLYRIELYVTEVKE